MAIHTVMCQGKPSLTCKGERTTVETLCLIGIKEVLLFELLWEGLHNRKCNISDHRINLEWDECHNESDKIGQLDFQDSHMVGNQAACVYISTWSWIIIKLFGEAFANSKGC